MGSVLKVDQDFAGNMMENKSIQEERWKQLLQQLSELSEVELWRVQCCLSQTLLPNFPPIPRHCLHCADALKTAITMILCYHEDGALSVLATALNLMSPEHSAFNHIMSPTRTKSVRTPVFELVSLPELKMAPDFVRTLRRRLISRIQRPDSVLDALQSNRILNPANRKAVNIYAVNKHKNRALVDLILMKGHEAQQALLQILSQSEPFMLEELNNDLIREKRFQDSSDLLESLLLEELRCFQWLVTDDLLPPYNCLFDLDELKNADSPTTKKLLQGALGYKQAARITKKLVMKIAPALYMSAEPVIH
ncbi:uncharacterized protein LOC124873760 [Girardinichthys multiradiatus]|uniref:uncharacterized protein LOC124873760 n=1 Tax=Girardinichthys multiradiatus TaxID=208333 RepID=UPI001FAC7E65|nr:uncharacterized protein LOC124873760 [Girardinichthys multiradiatus]